MYLGQAASEPTISQTQQLHELVDIFSSSPLHAVLILLGVGFIVLSVASQIEGLGFKFHAKDAGWLVIPGALLLSLGFFTHPQFRESIAAQNKLKVENLHNDTDNLLRAEAYEKAIKPLTDLTKGNLRDARAWDKLALALALQKQPDFDQALEASDKAITLRSDHSGSWYSRAVILVKKAGNKIKEAEQTQKGSLSILFCLNEAIRSNKDWEKSSQAKAWFYKGILLELLERKQEAREAFDKVLELDPGFKIGNEVRQRNGMPLNSEVTQPSGNKGSTQTDQVTIQDTFNAKAINDHINQGAVLFSDSEGNIYRGQIVESEIRDRQNPAESGVKASINWDDGKTSSVLFMKKSRVRVFVIERPESGGSWEWKPGDSILRISMDNGSKYEVSPSVINDFIGRFSTNLPKEETLKAKNPDEEINIRSGAGTDFEKLHVGFAGDKVTVISSARDKSNAIWYRVEFSSGAQGWVHQKFIDVKE
jgi:Bacterial SH3 domain/Tetratricopeptide repeat